MVSEKVLGSIDILMVRSDVEMWMVTVRGWAA